VRILQELPQEPPPEGSVVTLGVFDGVHLGHRHLIGRAVEAARRRGIRSAVLTFTNHPQTVLRGKVPIGYITSVPERVRLLQGLGPDMVLPVTFDLPLSRLGARDFLGLLLERLRMRHLVVGPDFALGHRREGDVPTLERLGREMGFTLEVVPPLYLGEVLVRSTAVRQALVRGDVSLAARLLGRPFALEGEVAPGRGRGRHLGFPTANLEVDPCRVVPGDGVYATWAYVEGERLPSATSIGSRPTFNEEQRTVETYIMDLRGDLYGHPLRLEFVRRLRGQVRFESPQALQAQIERDVARARAALEEG